MTVRKDEEALLIEPRCAAWGELAARRLAGELDGVPLEGWRERSKAELGLATTRPVIATGHQSLLWHPGILCKYMLVDAVARAAGMATANLVVDQHVDSPGGNGFDEYDVPIRRDDCGLGVRRVRLTSARRAVPMGMHASFDPEPAPTLDAPLPSVSEGVARIHDAVAAHRDAPNAAIQMAEALGDLMRPWAASMQHVGASRLLSTDLGAAIVERMVDEPRRCAEIYNQAVAEVSDSGIRPLAIRDDYVELPLWRIMPDGRRLRGYDGDAQRWLERRDERPSVTLMPRALLMTALVRTAMCDLFVHGTGGARYDRAMEIWMERWLGVTVAPIAVATATLRLPIGLDGERVDPAAATAAARRLWHDPDAAAGDAAPSRSKQPLLEAIEVQPRRSPQRRAAFHAMHRALEASRARRRDAVEAARQRAVEAAARAASEPIAARRTWPFPIYPSSMLDGLAERVGAAVC